MTKPVWYTPKSTRSQFLLAQFLDIIILANPSSRIEQSDLGMCRTRILPDKTTRLMSSCTTQIHSCRPRFVNHDNALRSKITVIRPADWTLKLKFQWWERHPLDTCSPFRNTNAWSVQSFLQRNVGMGFWKMHWISAVLFPSLGDMVSPIFKLYVLVDDMFPITQVFAWRFPWKRGAV